MDRDVEIARHGPRHGSRGESHGNRHVGESLEKGVRGGCHSTSKKRAKRELGPFSSTSSHQAFEPFQTLVAQLGIYNSLAQLLIKITAPGVPDFYQGSELWELNLVDPDNRRQVDYAMRRATLAGLSTCTPADLLEQRADGHVKMFVTNRALAARAELRGLYEQGDYVPLQTSGARRDSLFAFARTMPGSASMAITCVPRLVASLTRDATPPMAPAVWIDTRIDLPAALTAPARFRNVFTGAIFDVELAGGTGMMPAAAIFERFPVALLVPCFI